MLILPIHITYKPIKIFNQTYSLPVICGDFFYDLQGDIQQHQGIFNKGKDQGTFLFKMFKSDKKVTVEERFIELDCLYKDYNSLITFLQEYEDAYQSFFLSLTGKFQELVSQKLNQLLQDELNRKNLAQQLRYNNNNSLLFNGINKKKDYQTLLILANGFLLMLKKIDSLLKGIENLINDQNSEKLILAKMQKKLERFHNFYKFKRRKHKTEELEELSIELKEIFNPFLQQFESFINRVVIIDNELNYRVSEIQDLEQNINNSENTLFFEGYNLISNDLLDLLAINEQKKVVLIDFLKKSETQNVDFLLNNDQLLDECIKIESAIANLKVKIKQQLTEMSNDFTQIIELKEMVFNEEKNNHNDYQKRKVIEWKPSEVLNYQKIVITPSPSKTPSSSKTPSLSKVKQRNNIYTEILPGEIGLDMVEILAGSFMMGSMEYNNAQPMHRVDLKGFYIGKYPITQAQYQAIMNQNPSKFKNENNPVEYLNWYKAKEFCRKLSAKTGKEYKLPSESQWEYACRAGNQGRWCFGDDKDKLDKYAWYNEDLHSHSHPVGEKECNEWGLYDMYGNVWEWCEDYYVENYENTPTDGKAYISNKLTKKVLRGGSWNYLTGLCDSALRHCEDPSYNSFLNGFRVVLHLF